MVDGLFGERERIIIDKDESRYPRYIAAGLKSFRSEKKNMWMELSFLITMKNLKCILKILLACSVKLIDHRLL